MIVYDVKQILTKQHVCKHDLNVRLCALYQVHQEILKWVRAHPIYIDLFGHANILKAPSFDWLIINILASALQCVNVI